jgi:pimeloyl-ACP methyl ester carboxylesterase
VIATKEIQIKRPPVVLVHGTFSSRDTWTVLPPKLRALGYSVDLANYEGTHSAHFAENIPKIYSEVRHAITDIQASHFAASQVDLVAHSMGGVLCRFHVQSASRQAENYFKGDVHKLITLGATHWGSYWAGVAQAVKTCKPSIYETIRNGLLLGSGFSVDLDGGAAEDQVPGSAALLNLRTTTISGHAFASSVAGAPDGTWQQDPIQSLWFLLNIGIIGDGVVSEESARGGIDGDVQITVTLDGSGRASDTLEDLDSRFRSPGLSGPG